MCCSSLVIISNHPYSKRKEMIKMKAIFVICLVLSVTLLVSARQLTQADDHTHQITESKWYNVVHGHNSPHHHDHHHGHGGHGGRKTMETHDDNADVILRN